MRRTKGVYLLIGLLCGLALTSFASLSAGTTGGTESDPIVTKSYVEKRLLDLQSQLNDTNQAALLSMSTAQEVKNTNFDSKLAELTAKMDSLKNTSTGVGVSTTDFVLVQVKKGDMVTTGDSGMIIMRAGTAQTVASSSGGLSDLTDGKNLSNNQAIATNHLLLVSKNDGRGIKMTFDGWLMIKGSYKIQTTK